MARISCVNACDYCHGDGFIDKLVVNEEGGHWRESLCRHCLGRKCPVCCLELWEYADCCEVDWH